MTADRAEVDRIARLARLRLESEEADRLTEELNRILLHVERLRTADAGSGPEAAVGDTASLDSVEVGEDGRRPGLAGVREGDEGPDALALQPEHAAPEWAEGFFVVPPPPGVTADVPEQS